MKNERQFNLFQKLLQRGSYNLFVEEPLDNPEEEQFRIDVCTSNPVKPDGTGCYYEKANICSVCKCVMVGSKVKMLKHNTADKGVIVTHCPLGKWNDKHIAEHYKKEASK